MESKIKASRMLDEFFFHKLPFPLLSMYSPKTCFSGWCPLMPLINLQNSNFHSTKLPNVTKYSNSMHSLCLLNRKCNSNRNSADLKMNFRCRVNFSSRKSYVKQTCVGNVHCYVKSIENRRKSWRLINFSLHYCDCPVCKTRVNAWNKRWSGNTVTFRRRMRLRTQTVTTLYINRHIAELQRQIIELKRYVAQRKQSLAKISSRKRRHTSRLSIALDASF